VTSVTFSRIGSRFPDHTRQCNTWRLQGPRGSQGVPINSRFAVNDMRVLAQACVAGLGIALLPQLIVEPVIAQGKLVRVLPTYRRASMGLGLQLVYTSRPPVPAAVAVFAEFLLEKPGEYTEPTGELIVTAPVGLGRLHLIPILTDFFKAYPEIDMRLILSDRIFSLLEENVDVALRNGELPDSNLIALRVGTIHRVVCASPAYLKARGTPRAPNELAGHDCISYAGFFGPDVWTFVRDKTNVAVPVHSRLVVGSVEEACDAARAGVGITIAFSFHVKAALDAGSLTTLLDNFQPPTLPVNLVYTADRFLPIKVRAFLDFAAPRLRARLAT
jgi:DNA-binding transcriptional LysR family regulator